MSAALLLVAAVILGGGCSLLPEPMGRSPLVPQTGPVLELLASKCANCHGEGMQLPAFPESGDLPKEVALSAALMLASGRMPPAPRVMADPDRRSLIEGLCRVGAPDIELCMRAYVPSGSSRLVRGPAEFMRALTATLPPNSSVASAGAETLMQRYVNPERRIVRFDPTLEVLTVLLADERCPASDPSSDNRAFANCAATALDPGLWEIPGDVVVEGGRTK
jgi:hypothetical protein